MVYFYCWVQDVTSLSYDLPISHVSIVELAMSMFMMYSSHLIGRLPPITKALLLEMVKRVLL